MTAQALLARLFIRCVGEEVPTFSWWDYCVVVVPIGICTGVDISCSNMAFLYLSVSMITIIKSAAPFFILLFSFSLGLEAVSKRLVAVVLIICVGTGLATSSAIKAEGKSIALGVFLCLVAIMCAGARWALTQWMMQRGVTKMSPLVALRYTAPVCAMSVFPAAAWKEMPELFRSGFVSDFGLATQTTFLLSIGMVMAFMLVLAEYYIIHRFSAITLTIAGVIKEMLTIYLSIMFYNDSLHSSTWLGALLIIAAVVYYSYLKTRPDLRGQSEMGNIPVGGGTDIVRCELMPLDEEEYFMPMGQNDGMGLEPHTPQKPPKRRGPTILDRGVELMRNIKIPRKNGYTQVSKQGLGTTL